MISERGLWVAVPADPVEPDEATRALLADRIGFGPGGRLLGAGGRVGPWLLHVAPVGELDRVEAMSAPAGGVCLGPVDRVRVLSPVRLELGAPVVRWGTLRALAGLSTVEGKPLQFRYLTVVADQYDEAGRRVQRVAGAWVKLSGFDMGGRGDEVTAEVETTRAPLAWWASYPVEPVAAERDEVDVVEFGGRGTRTEWLW
jgi:hypothetical protein